MNEVHTDPAPLLGYPRHDGRKGIRNVVAVAYLVECAHHVASAIVSQFAPRLADFDVDDVDNVDDGAD
ncbi:MAG: UxaA family hydrolase, partial [Trinickia sp.]